MRICRRLAEDRGWVVNEVIADRGVSGASHLRAGYQRLLEEARRQRFDVVVAESLDRISRDQEHIAAFHKAMRFQSISVVTVAEGLISELHVGLKGTMSALYLKDLAQKTLRGLEGRVRAGKSAGGLSYGYRLDRQTLPDGTLTTGERRIDPAEAAMVQRIFAAYDAGQSARTIAIALNRDGVPAPRGEGAAPGTWSFSTIPGTGSAAPAS